MVIKGILMLRNISNRKWRIYILFLPGFLLGMICWESVRKYPGVIRFAEKLYPTGNNDDRSVRHQAVEWPGYSNDSLLVLLVFGQSNAANYGQEKYTCTEEVYQFHEGRFYPAADPLLGANNVRGSVWGRLADLLIESKRARRILIVPVAVGLTRIDQWAPGGEHHDKLMHALQQLQEQDILIDLICCHQGESDNLHNTTRSDYVASFESLLSSLQEKGVDAPLFLAIASYQPGKEALTQKSLGCDTSIQNAQKQLIAQHEQLFEGANTDQLIMAHHRYDGVHFSVTGLQQHASLWLEAIENSGVLAGMQLPAASNK